MNEFMKSTDVIDWKHPDIVARARSLATGCDDLPEVIRRCFAWVRDKIKHSHDHGLQPVTCSASEVLRVGSGICFAKSHLLAALLRANGVPTALCYQRLRCDDEGTAFSLHGLNAVHLPEYGWYRIDARGNRADVHAQFTPPTERLAFQVSAPGEADIPGLFADPLPEIVAALTSHSTLDELWNNLPDPDLATTIGSSRETYTPGHSQNATEFMARRTIESHGEFFLPYLTPGISVLDCGCGPGSITLSIANRIGKGRVVGVDFGESQTQRAIESAKERCIRNADFQHADCYSLPFEDASFDRVFSNALMAHLTDPVRAMREMLRVLKPGGVIGVSSPDWAGFVLAPASDALTSAVAAYTTLQTRNGGDVNVGRKLGTHLKSAGFVNCQMTAQYEVYPSLPLIGEYLAIQLERAGDSASAATFRKWRQHSGGMFAQCWVSCLAQKPSSMVGGEGIDRNG